MSEQSETDHVPPSPRSGLIKLLDGVMKKKKQATTKPKFSASQGSMASITSSLNYSPSKNSHMMSFNHADIPPDDELDVLFSNMMRDNLEGEKLLEVINKLSRDSKWQMVLQSGRMDELQQGRYTAEYFMQRSRESGLTAYLDQDFAASMRIQLTNQPLT